MSNTKRNEKGRQRSKLSSPISLDNLNLSIKLSMNHSLKFNKGRECFIFSIKQTKPYKYGIITNKEKKIFNTSN